MSQIVIEQATFRADGGATQSLLARSPGFLDDWLPEAERLCQSFGTPPAGAASARYVFAQPFARRYVAIVQVEGPVSASLAYHLMILRQETYGQLGADPFAIAERLPPDWSVRGELPVLTLADAAIPPRTVGQLQSVLQRGELSPILLGGAQALLDGGRLVFERPPPDSELVRDVWMLLPTATRLHLWPASYAYSNALGFAALVVPRAEGDEFKHYLSEQQAGDYPPGHYEFNLQMAVEAGDQRELDVLLSRRSRRETWRMGLLLLAVVFFLAALSNWLTPQPESPPQKQSRPAASSRTGKAPSNSSKEAKPSD